VGSQRAPIFRCLSIYVYTLCCRTAKFHTLGGEGLVFRWLAISHLKWWGPSAPFHLSVQPLSQNYQFDVETCQGGTCISGQPGLLSQESEAPVLPNSWDSPVFIPASINTVRRTTEFDMVTHGEGRVLRSATPLRLHKCVARFVSDSRVSC